MAYKIEDDKEGMFDYEPQIIDEIASEYYCTSCMALMEIECCCGEID
jgi:hypothetical protein